MIRYPGSKDKIAQVLIARFPYGVTEPLFQHGPIEYREPFFGGGAIGFRLIERLPNRARVWINDKDYGVACLWRAALQAPAELIARVESFEPSTDYYYLFKEEDGRVDLDPVEAGFRKFALHQMSFSGLGAKSGGPIGGRKQSSEYNVGCRWNGPRHSKAIADTRKLLARFASVKVSSGDFARLIDSAPPHTFIYADPPYYEAGPALYKFAMSDDDHRRLAASLRACRSPWVLSYDDRPFVRELYSWAHFESVAVKYTTAVSPADGIRRKNSEVVITPWPAERATA